MASSMSRFANFYNLQLAYFIALSFIGTLVLWLSPKQNSVHSLTFVDALFNAVSSLSVTGLASVDMQKFSVLDEITLLILMILGSQVFTSLIPLLLRRHSMNVQQQIGHEIVRSVCEESVRSIASLVDTESTLWSRPSIAKPGKKADELEESFDTYTLTDLELATPVDPAGSAKQAMTLESFKQWQGEHDIKEEDWKRRFQELGDTDREFLEVIDSIKLKREAMAALARIVAMYFAGVQIVGFVICELYFQFSRDAALILRENRTNHVFFSLFSSISAFSNAGYTLIDTNLVPFQRSAILVLCLCILILLGNTMFAPSLRLIISLLRGCASGRKMQVYDYLLQHPRKCFTHLFPHNQTLWLVGLVVILNGAQMISIYGLDWNSIAFNGLGARYKILNGLFQSITTRNAGMNTINFSFFSAPTLFLMMVMMYVAVYPVFISRQQSQESLQQDQSSKHPLEKNIYSVTKKLLARDSVCLFIAIFLICVTERDRISDDPLNFSIFNIIFEIVSGYGNVGLSMGYNCKLLLSPGTCEPVNYSLSGKWTVEGKLILIIVMLLGRNRGLPDNDDSAIRLPSHPALFGSMIESWRKLHGCFMNTQSDSLSRPTGELTDTQKHAVAEQELSSYSDVEQSEKSTHNTDECGKCLEDLNTQDTTPVDQPVDDHFVDEIVQPAR